MTAPPIQAGQAQVRIAAIAQNHGQKFARREVGRRGEERPAGADAVLDALVDEGRLQHDGDRHEPVHVERAARGDVRQEVGLAAADRDAEVDRLRAQRGQHAREGQWEGIGDLADAPGVSGAHARRHGLRRGRDSVGHDTLLLGRVPERSDMSRAPPATGPGSTKGREGAVRRAAVGIVAGRGPAAVRADPGGRRRDRKIVRRRRPGACHPPENRTDPGVGGSIRHPAAGCQEPVAGRLGWHRGPRFADRGGAP